MKQLLVLLLFFMVACSANKQSMKSTTSETSLITCPECGFSKNEKLPTEQCLLVYRCDSCQHVMHPKEGYCCVFCTHGNHKCPSKH